MVVYVDVGCCLFLVQCSVNLVVEDEEKKKNYTIKLITTYRIVLPFSRPFSLAFLCILKWKDRWHFAYTVYTFPKHMYCVLNAHVMFVNGYHQMQTVRRKHIIVGNSKWMEK